MSEVPHFLLVKGDDWMGLYQNGKLLCENHHLGISDLSDEAMGQAIRVSVLPWSPAIDAYLDFHGSFPKSLADLTKDPATYGDDDG